MKAKMSNAHKKKEIKLNTELIKKILRTVPQNEAFYFFADIGEYTGEYATSLDNFCNKINNMELKSVLFHFDRQDFEKWIKGTIGDTVLADKISKIKDSVDREEVRTEIQRIVEQRLSQLKKLLASEDALIEHF
jgi:alpha-amylase